MGQRLAKKEPMTPSPTAQFFGMLGDIPFHPVLVFLFPVLSLLSFNVQELYPIQALRSLLVSLMACLLLWSLAFMLLRDVRRAAIVTSVAGLLFFTYGHIFPLVVDWRIGEFALGHHRYLLALWALLFVSLVLLVVRPSLSPMPATRVLNLIGTLLFVMPIASLLWYAALTLTAGSPKEERLPPVQLSAPANANLPDIYYIILDGYARADHMAEDIGLENGEFVRFLEDRGFVVLPESRSNHNYTPLSLSSSLNMTYVQELGVLLRRGYYPKPFIEPIRHSRVRQALEGVGYTMVALRTGYLPTEITDAGVFVSPDSVQPERVKMLGGTNVFEDMLAYSTLLRPLIDRGLIDLPGQDATLQGERATKHEIVSAAFDNLASLPDIDGPKFVFAHIIALHGPTYLFNRYGVPLEVDVPYTLLENPDVVGSGIDKYRDQAIYITRRTEEMVQAILDSSPTPPVIILQADHGSGEVPGMEQRTAILNAILVKEECQDSLYPSMTPVNSFRAIFNCYFDAGLPMLPDNVYWSPWPYDADYEFQLLNDQLD